MKPVRITKKSSLPSYTFGKGIEYRVMFEGIPDYIKEEWLECAEGICFEDEIKNPKIEMQAILQNDGSLEKVYFQYYFDDYEYFELEEEDEKEVCRQFVDFIRKNKKGLPDAYNPQTGELMGDCEWEEAAYQGK